jgi:hypothetical protein
MRTRSQSSGTEVSPGATETQALRQLAFKQREEWREGWPEALADIQAEVEQWMGDWMALTS